MSVVIAPAKATDLSEVEALERLCYSDPWPASAFATLPDNPRVYFAVARQDRQLAGFAIAWFVMDEGELANLAVTPSERRRGVGRLLLEGVINAATARGIRDLYLEVRDSNRAARELYANQEFEEVGRRKSYYRSPVEDALILRRTLKQSVT